MPKQTTHVRVVREWLTSLGILAAVSLPREEAQMRLAAFVPLLLDRFPDGAFTAASLEHVAAQAIRGFPTYGELTAWLGDWWRANRPMPPALPPPPPIRQRDEPTPEEIEHVTRVAAEAVAALRSSAQPEQRPRPQPRYFTAAQLLAEYRRLAVDAADPILQRAAAFRVGMLEQRLRDLRERTYAPTDPSSAAPVGSDAA